MSAGTRTPTSPGFPLNVAAAGLLSPSSGTASPRGFAFGPSSGSRPSTPSSVHSNSQNSISYDEVCRWDDSDIATWLHSAKLGSHAATFTRHDIRGAVVLDVDQPALKEMGITSVGDRVRIYAAIKALNKRCAETAAFKRASISTCASPRAFLPPLPPREVYQNGGNDGEMEFLENDLPGSDQVEHRMGMGMSNGMPISPAGTRRAGQMRPPPLLLKQSASRGLPGHASPVSSINNGQGFGLSAARGLTPGASRASLTSRTPPSAAKPLSAMSQASKTPDSSSSLHRKVNSTGTAGPALGSTLMTSKQPSGSLSANRPLQQTHGSASARPNTATGAGGYAPIHAGQGRNILGPGSSSSPTAPGFAQTTRPSTAGGISSYSSSTSSSANSQGSYLPLTPISESGSYGSTPTTPANTLQQQQQQSLASAGYSVGRGAFGGSRPIAPGREWSTSPSQHYTNSSSRRLETSDGVCSSSSPSVPGSTAATPVSSQGSSMSPPSLEDLKRRTIKFISEEDRTTRTVNVSDCRGAYDVMARVLKKFGKPASGNSYYPTAHQGPAGDELGATETWGIFATSAYGQNTKALSDNELLAICHAPQPHDPLRERGLTLRKIPNQLHSEELRRPRTGRNKLEAFFGERMPVTQIGLAPPGSPREEVGDAGSVTISGKKMKRASTVSIMSGLGVGPFGNSTGRNESNSRNSRNSGSSKDQRSSQLGPTSQAPSKPSKIRNFFGQRPPSELITTNLSDYFPSTEPKALQKTARRSIYGRASSIRSKRNSTWSFAADPEALPIPGKESMDSKRSGGHSPNPQQQDWSNAPIIHIGFDEQSDQETERQNQDAGPPTLPPVVGRSSLEDWSKSLQTVKSHGSDTAYPIGKTAPAQPGISRRTSGESSRSRKSLASQVRVGLADARDRGDTSSLLTVDEITQEVENRRESMSLASGSSGSFVVVDEDGVPIGAPRSMGLSHSAAASTRPSSGFSAGVSESPEIGGEMEDGRPTADAPRTSLDDGMAVDDQNSPEVTRRSTSRASSIHRSLEDSDDEEEYSNESEEDDEEGDEDDILQSHPDGKAPIKWHKGALIGAGSFGNVFLGMNAKNGLLMAVKQVELPSGDSHNDQRKKNMLEALEREIKLLKTLQHENIVQYLDSFADRIHLNIFLEYVPGGSIVALLRNYGAFEEPLVRNFVRQILHGLSFLHARDIVHRDIKGANILVDNKGGIKISDFGISKKVESDLLISARAHRPSLQGSVFWMAPEVVKQVSYTRKADIWSLGCLVVEMISGTHPWAKLNQMQALFQIGMSRKPQLPEEISPEAVDFLNKTFELDHNLRPSANELLAHPFITEEYRGLDGQGAGGEDDVSASDAGNANVAADGGSGAIGTLSGGAGNGSGAGANGTGGIPGSGFKSKSSNIGRREKKEKERDDKDKADAAAGTGGSTSLSNANANGNGGSSNASSGDGAGTGGDATLNGTTNPNE